MNTQKTNIEDMDQIPIGDISDIDESTLEKGYRAPAIQDITDATQRSIYEVIPEVLESEEAASHVVVEGKKQEVRGGFMKFLSGIFGKTEKGDKANGDDKKKAA